MEDLAGRRIWKIIGSVLNWVVYLDGIFRNRHIVLFSEYSKQF